MKLPDFLVIGAQKSGTTSLFVMLSKHPDLFLPARKELQFFSSEVLYPRGLDWYSEEFFATCPADALAGEVSPQYMYSTKVAQRVHAALPKAKLIAVLREPIDRAYSQYLMSVRRTQDTRPVDEAFDAASAIDEADTTTPESLRYFQFSDYATVLETYLRLYGREQILVLFQEDLDRAPNQVMKQITGFLAIPEAVPENAAVRVHQSGDVRFKALDRFMKSQSGLRRLARFLVPRKLRASLVFWLEIKNIRPAKKKPLPEDVRRKYAPFQRRQIEFLATHFGVTPPWPNAEEETRAT